MYCIWVWYSKFWHVYTSLKPSVISRVSSRPFIIFSFCPSHALFPGSHLLAICHCWLVFILCSFIYIVTCSMYTLLFGLASFTQNYYFEIHSCFPCIICPFFLTSEFYFIVWVCHHLFIHLLLYGHLGPCQFLPITKLPLNIHVQVIAWRLTFFSLEWIPRFGMTGSYDAMHVYELFRNCYTVFQSGAISHSHRWCAGSSSFTFSSVLVMVGVLTISLMISDVGHLFRGFYAIYISFLRLL